MAHDFGKVPMRGFHEKVVVIVHQAINMDCRPVPFGCGFKIREKLFSIPIVFKYLLLLVSPTGDVVKSFLILNP